ncbi:MAG: hypothetical protein M0R06_03080 [Sphaerochaeta sp.]|jgi:hypothetical protein|nr:hypothetical protein [Sphaerochaeta sp.]
MTKKTREWIERIAKVANDAYDLANKTAEQLDEDTNFVSLRILDPNKKTSVKEKILGIECAIELICAHLGVTITKEPEQTVLEVLKKKARKVKKNKQ